MTSVKDTIYLGEDDTTIITTSSSINSFISWGDTNLIATQRKPSSSTDIGNPGEHCFGTDSGVLYMYYCNSPNNWVRSAFSSF